MAVCGVEFSDEELKEEQKSAEIITEEQKEAMAFDHSLSNVVALSTTKKQNSINRKEGLLVFEDGEPKDRRMKVAHKDYKFWRSSIYSALQISTRNPGKTKGVGSGLAIILNGQPHTLTCAHNLVSWSPYYDRFVNYKEGLCYSGRNGEKEWRELYKLDMDKGRIHDKFNNDDAGGFDIGVCPINKIENGTLPERDLFSDCTWGYAKPESLKPGMKIELSGYPGEKEGFQYISNGEIVKVKQKNDGGWVLYYNADTTPGMSGTPIRIVDKDWLEENLTFYHKMKGKKKKTIGIHTGHDDPSMLNFGTLITSGLYNWIHGKE